MKVAPVNRPYAGPAIICILICCSFTSQSRPGALYWQSKHNCLAELVTFGVGSAQTARTVKQLLPSEVVACVSIMQHFLSLHLF